MKISEIGVNTTINSSLAGKRIYISLDFINLWSKDVRRLNRGKVGAPYDYPKCLMVFLAYLHVLLNIDYRGLEGFLRGLSRLVHLRVPD